MDEMDALTSVLIAKSPEHLNPIESFGVNDGTLTELIRNLPAAAAVIDVGCVFWRLPPLAAEIGRFDLAHVGVDIYAEPPGRPDNATFIAIKQKGDSFCHRSGDLVVSSHCLEHSSQPIVAFGGLVRACKPGGVIYVECPSEFSTFATSSDDPRDHGFESFWDDPTHVRPWSPGALYRLAIG